MLTCTLTVARYLLLIQMKVERIMFFIEVTDPDIVCPWQRISFNCLWAAPVLRQTTCLSLCFCRTLKLLVLVLLNTSLILKVYFEFFFFFFSPKVTYFLMHIFLALFWLKICNSKSRVKSVPKACYYLSHTKDCEK